MFFLIRCVFWLSIVFSSMSWTIDTSRPPEPHAFHDAIVQGGLAMAGVVKDAAISQVRGWCVKSSEQCMADAAQLTSLIVANQSDDTTTDAVSLSDETQTYPLPRADPRRHILSRAGGSPRS